jgi:phage tail sheath protein FI
VPEYLAPGVYVEETSFRAKSIEGVSTSTTGFVGLTRKGPIDGTPELITSFGDFERIYGGFADLELSSGSNGAAFPNYLAHAVRAYFDNGGSRLYVARVWTGEDAGTSASALRGDGNDDKKKARFAARFPGQAGDGRVIVRLVRSPATGRGMAGAAEGSVLKVRSADPQHAGQFLEKTYIKTGGDWLGDGDTALNVSALDPAKQPDKGADFITANVLTIDADGDQKFYEDLGLAPSHPRYAGSVLGSTPGRRIDALENQFALELGEDVEPLRLVEILTPAGTDDAVTFTLTGGSDGAEPGGSDYEAAFDALGRIEGISIVAAPGHSAYTEFQAIQNELIQHAERRRAYRIAVLDTPPGQTVGQAIDVRSRIDSTRAALYYPWVVTDNPLARPGFETIAREITLPPSGFVCGIYARNDIERTVAKAPANEVVRGALRFETDINFAEQEVLNPAGVNCMRYFPGRGYRVWGARTASSDPEWKYVNVRRYFLYLEQSVDRGTQWAVFENNGERLWANVRETIESFLYNEWRSGNLLGGAPAEAYFVRCDRSTMTQNDLDNGRLICLIGVAVLKPAEFVVFRIGQKTADART